MSKLEKKLIELLNIKSYKQNLVRLQKWDQAAETREKERLFAREFYNILTGKDDGQNWILYDASLKEYCIRRFGIHDANRILKMIDREEKLKQLGI